MKTEELKKQWNTIGSQYAKEINDMVDFIELHGWDKWEEENGAEAEDTRTDISGEVVKLLIEANENGTVSQFREDFPPAHAPVVPYLDRVGQHIEQLLYINDKKIIFFIGAAYQYRQGYLLEDDEVTELDEEIYAIGKSKQNNIFAISTSNKIVTTKGWEGETIATFDLVKTEKIAITELIPFNDGQKVLLIAADGIYLISKDGEQLIHPENSDEEEEYEDDDQDEEDDVDEEDEDDDDEDDDDDDYEDDDDEEYTYSIAMENATLSNDNEYIVVGDQASIHRVLDKNGTQIGTVGQQSEYPHFCIFSKDDAQLVTNSCHFYTGITIGVDTKSLKGVEIEPYIMSDDSFKLIDEIMRVYCAVATSKYYIFGDAHGYIRAIDKDGKHIWRHFLGSTVSGITISDDEQTLWVGCCSGMLHRLQIDKGLRDNHTLANSKNYEDFRLLFWSGLPVLKW